MIGGAGGGEFFDQRKIELRLGSGETSTQMQPRICRFRRFRRRPRLAEPDQVADWAVEHALLVLVAALELRGLDRVESAPPGVAIAAPLRMQCAHPSPGAPQRHAGADEALTQAIEQRRGVSAAQTLADCPDVQFNDFLPERPVEALREGRHQRRSWRVGDRGWVYRNL